MIGQDTRPPVSYARRSTKCGTAKTITIDKSDAAVLDKRQTSGNRQPIAIRINVYCKVDAQYGAIEVGDLLTTSPTHDYAMKATDSPRTHGSVIGKALLSSEVRQGLIPILIALK